MAYCGICNKHDVTTEIIKDGYYCSGCDENHYFDEIDKQRAIKMLPLVKNLKKEGWKKYPNCDFLGEPIDEVIKEYDEIIKQHAKA